MEKCYPKGVVLGGVVYIHDISRNRSPRGIAQRNLEIFGHLCGDPGAVSKTILVTSQWGTTHSTEFERREKELKEAHWGAMINIDLAEGGGARAMRLEDDDEGSTLNIVNMILERVDKWAGQTLEDEAPWPIQKSSARKHIKTDIVILLTGETGAGKSSFINALLGQAGDQKRFRVGEALVSCTTQVESAFIEGQTGNYRHIRGQRVVVVDTPGFDDTFAADLQILKRITLWLDESHKRNMVLGGIVYLHDISVDRFSESARKSLTTLTKLCRDTGAGLEKVVMVTTKWEREDGTVNKFAAKEEELKGIYQKSAQSVEKGDDVTVERWNPCNGIRAWEIVHTLLKRFDAELGLESQDSDSGQVALRERLTGIYARWSS